MSTPFIGQITMFGGNFAPRTWAFCNGQLLGVSQNQALFSLIGTTYGGDGISTFQLPNMISRLPIHFGSGPGLSTYQLGQNGGVNTVTITSNTMPHHTHAFNATSANATSTTVAGNLPAQPTGTGAELYASGTGLTAAVFANSTVMLNGSNQPHSNMMPSLCVTFIIALQGIFPSRN